MLITNPILMFAFIMFLLLAAPAVFERMKMPGIVGLIMAGILVGPHAAGILRPEGSIELFSSVGLIYIMFLAGLEINLHEFSRQKKYSIVFGTLTFLLPMVLGTLGARALFSFSWPAAVLLASMFASHTLIPFPATVRLGISRHRSVVASVGGTIITDTAALLVLAFIVEMVSTNLTPVFIVRQLAFLLLLIIFAMWGLPRLTSLFFRVLSPDGVTEFVLILALVFLTSYFAQLAGVEPIIGAFFAGLALSQMIADQSSLKNRLEFVGNALFIPFFLISVGMLVNMNVIFSTGKVWPMAVFMVACVIAG
ncbi:MAG TPA: cation:proton antiporter, partial [Candidatus Omnitrophota bacterium]|nr:cation:proton antiporter [Candidatus Omnitrophota bacterium]